MHLSSFYQSALSACDDRIRVIRRKSNILSLLRLLLFAGLVYTLYLLVKQFSPILLILSILLAALFIAGVNYYFRLKDDRVLWEKLRFINANELGVLAGEANGFSDGLVFLDPENYLDDLDVFGKASLFHTLNRTTTSHGTTALAVKLRQPHLSTGEILQQQDALKGLAGQADLRRLLMAKGLVTGEKEGNLDSLTRWLGMEPRIYPHKWLRAGIAVLTLFNCWAIYVALASGNLLPLIAGILVCRLVTGYFAKAIGEQHELISRKQAILQQYAEILSVFHTADAAGSSVLQTLTNRAGNAYNA